MNLNSCEFALMMDDLRPMPIIKQIMIYNKRSNSKIIPEYLETVIQLNRDMSNLFNDMFYCEENALGEEKLKMYKRLMNILEDIKNNFFKPLKFNPLTDFIDNFIARYYNFQDKNSPVSMLQETLRDHVLNEVILQTKIYKAIYIR